jgi:hypothetical protein
MNNSKRAIYRLDQVSNKFYVYCLYYSKDKNYTKYNKKYVFYVGKAKNTPVLSYRREREHIRESYQKEYWNFHKSRKIRILEKQRYFIMSKVLEEFNTEEESYKAEYKWEKFFLNNGNDLTNMIKCGIKSLGSGPGHPAYNQELRKDGKKIIKLYTIDFWPIQKICRHFKLSQKTVKKILFEESNNKQRTKNLRSPIWKNQKNIVRLYKENMPSAELGKKYGCPSTTILDVLRANNVPVRQRSKQKKSSKAWLIKDKIIREFLSGKSKKDLCKKYKCDTKCTLNPMLEEAGLI